MVTTGEIFDALNALAPVERKMGSDNVGLLVGGREDGVSRVLAALDITLEVIEEARELGAELIVSHHPVMFELKSVVSSDLVGHRVLSLARAGIDAICMHTNLDVAERGVNDALARALDLAVTGPLGEEGIGRVGTVEERGLREFLPFVKSRLGANGLRFVDAGKNVRVVGVCGGSGGSELMRAFEKGCDTYICADVKYHQFLDARELGVNIIDAGHFPTENVVVEPVAEYLRGEFPGLEVLVSRRHRQVEDFFV